MSSMLASALRRAFWLILCAFLPAVALYYAIGPAGDTQAVDFHFNYYLAAEAMRAGEDFYPTAGFIVRGPDDLIVDYVYPPLVGLLTVPWTFVSVGVAEVVIQVVLALAFVGTLAILGVRDWRCYGLAFLWPPVTDAVRTGNISILLGLAAAVVWTYRDRARLAGPVLGVSIAAKLFLWPLTAWLASTSRLRAAVWSVTVAGSVAFASWAVVGFRGLTEYPELVSKLTDRMDERSYTAFALLLDIGASVEVAWALWAVVAVATLATSVVLGIRGDEQRAFILALAGAIAFSPIVWLHYFALLLVPVAIAQPRLGAMWFIGLPLQVVVTTAVYNGSTFQTLAVLGAAVLTVGLALGPAAWRAPFARDYEPSRATTVISSLR